MKNYFEYQDDKSHKFWEITLEGLNLTTRYGKINTDGQVSEKTFESDEKAEKEYNKLIAEKIKKGYKEINDNFNIEIKPTELKVSIVEEDSPAEKSGFLIYDIILQLNKVKIKNREHLAEIWPQFRTKNDNVFLVKRDNIEIEINMKESGLGINVYDAEIYAHWPLIKASNRTKTNDKNLENAIELICKNESELNGEIIDEFETFYERNKKIIELHSGDTLFENLSVGNAICLINGNLTVKNLIEDCQEVDSSLLIVLGDVKCKNLITTSSIFIKGNLSVENVILAESGCNCTLYVMGDIKTKTILEYGHSISGYKKIKAKNIFSFNSVEDEKGAIEANLTSEDLVDEIVEIDSDERIENLSNTIDFIKNGGTKFHK